MNPLLLSSIQLQLLGELDIVGENLAIGRYEVDRIRSGAGAVTALCSVSTFLNCYNGLN